MPGTEYDDGEKVWIWNYDGQQLFMDPGNWIRFRVEQSQFIDVGPVKEDDDETVLANRPAPYTIYVDILLILVQLCRSWSRIT
jgi:DNA-directed RNA polymerase subunit E'/Rpb7